MRQSSGVNVPIRTPNDLAKLTKDAKKAADAIRELNEQTERAQKLGGVPTSMSGNGGGSGSGSGSGSQRTPVKRGPSNPWQKLSDAKGALANNPNSKAHQLATVRAQRAATRADEELSGPSKLSMARKLMGAKNMAGVVDALGVAPEAAVPLLALSAAIVTLGATAKQAADDLNGQTGLRFSGGGNYGETSRAAGFAAAGLSMSPQEFGGMARAISNQIMSSGAAANVAARAGVNVYRGPFGDLNDTSAALKIIKDIVNDPSDENARRKTRFFGGTLPEDQIALLRAASPGVRNDAMNFQAAQLNPQNAREAADAQLRLNMAMAEFAKLGTEIGSTVLPVVNTALESIIHPGKTLIESPGKTIGNWLVNTALGNPSGIGMPDWFGAGKSNSTDANTKATKELTDAIDKNTQIQAGNYGGFKSGMPKGWGVAQNMNQITSGAIPRGIW